ncbi:hypothetical protein [Burkholderia pseudomallei]|uniref:hypothetical protein n=1 Tax=Burkholderia pseudomallei TaxID=28450 RepID=UPI00193D9AD2|nr:hypothetical protein [Burkholderia pseudomallei]QRM23511.1 hypothetical protein JQX71_04300 [Burkholderia pseudomallei]
MSTTPNLNLELLAVQQAQKEQTVNDSLSALDTYLGGSYTVVVNDSSPGQLVPGSDVVGYRVVVLTGNSSANKTQSLTLPFTGREWFVINKTDASITVTLANGSAAAIALPNGQAVHVVSDGTTFYKV